MREFGRVFGRKVLMFLAVLGIMNLILFLLCVDPGKKITMTGQELEYYLEKYPIFLEKTVNNGSVMGVLSMYQKGFASESLKKITQHYVLLKGTQVVTGDNSGTVFLLQYRLTDLFLMVFLFLVVMEFRAERKKGLVYMVRSTLRGRGILYLQRMGVLAVATLLGALVFYGGNFLGITCSMGMDRLGRSIQSLPEFMKCPYSMTIGGYLVLAICLKMIGCLTVAILFYTLVGCLDSILAYLVSGVFLAAEFAVGIFIAPVSVFNGFRYLNIFTLIRVEDYFTDCVYLNVFGRAVQALPLMLFLIGSLLVMSVTLGFVVYGRRYVSHSRAGERFLELLAGIKERFALQRTLFGWETYKLLIRQGGLWILTAVLMIHISISVKYKYIFPVDTFEQLWYVRFHGELTEETVRDAEKSKENLVRAQLHLEETLERIRQQVPMDEDRYDEVNAALSKNLMQQAALDVVLENIYSGMEYTERTGNSVHLIEPYIYHMLLNLDEKTKSRASFLTLVAVIGSVAGVFAFDRQNHMEQWIHTSYRGRRRGVLCKLGVVILLCAGSCVLLHLVQLLSIGSQMDPGYQDIGVPVQSLPFLRDFPIYLSIRGYLILLFALRGGIACLMGLAIAGISSRCSDVVTALGIGTFLTAVMVALSGALPGGEWLNPIFLLNGGYFR